MVAGEIEFVKAYVNGNDFVIVFQTPEMLDEAMVRMIADRRYGVGCDQILCVQPIGTFAIPNGHYSVTIFNSDCTSAKMCGNGVCAVAACVAVFNGHKDIDITVDVCDAEYSVKVCGPDVAVEFPLPTLLDSGIVSTGNKHVIRGMSEVADVSSISMSHSECNIHFVDVVSNTKIRMKTFERGVGWTNACGSGAVASVYYLRLKDRIGVIHDGGMSFVEVLGDRAYLTVQPRIVFKGVWYGQSIV
ncbi:MAG: hypothetical protein LBD43_00930 [Holosporales bacterium]|jgi:diaminopimelate epimerase|nr:hypothetical protein [Holosporales bacterium]